MKINKIQPEPAGAELSTSVLNMDYEELMRNFKARLSAASVDAYERDLNYFATFCKRPSATVAGALLIGLDHGSANMLADRFRSHMLAAKLAPNTVNRRLSALRSICKLAHRFGKIPWLLSVDNVKREKRRDVSGPGVDGVKKMLAAAGAQKNRYRRARDVAMLTIMFTDGLRRNEVLTADFSDFDLENATVAVLGKGKREKVKLPLPAPAVAAMEALFKVRGRQPGPVFVNKEKKRLTGRGIYAIVRRIGALVGIRTRPHGFRHTCFTSGHEAGISTLDLMALSRHADTRTLEGYIDAKKGTAKQVSDKISLGLK